jgi:3',5'-cyclic AMP phosphodiesterase CpdA
MTVLLQISDTHFGTEREHVAAALLKLAHQLKPAALIFSGDVTQRARRSQFAAAREFVTRIAAPVVIAIPGNHDIPLFNVFARVFYPYAGFEREFGTQLDPEWRSDEFLVTAVNTTRRYRHKDGEVSAEQIDSVARRLRDATDQQLRVVVTHQPVHVLRGSEVHNRLHGYAEAITTWAQAGADIIMGGHIHLPYIAPLHEHYPQLARRCWVVQAGTAVSSRVRKKHPNSVNVIRRSQTLECIAERWDYHADDNAFTCVKTEHLHLQRAAEQKN